MKYGIKEKDIRRMVNLFLDSRGFRTTNTANPPTPNEDVFFYDGTEQLMYYQSQYSQLLIDKELLKLVSAVFGIQIDRSRKLVKLWVENKLNVKISNVPNYQGRIR